MRRKSTFQQRAVLRHKPCIRRWILKKHDARVHAILGPMRLPFLVLTPVCVLLGAATVVHAGHPVSLPYLLVALAGAVAAHVAVNSLNEYDDFRSGLDFRTRRTPFSGGSGALPAQPGRGHYGLIIGLAAMAGVAATGIFFWARHGSGILPIGVAGMILIVVYTPLLTRSALLCLIAPGLGFGTFMVMGTHFALTGGYSWTAFTASLVPFFMVSNLLLMNQYPDIEADREAGRRHLIISRGRRAGVVVFAAFHVSAYLSIAAGFALGLLPAWGMLSLMTMILALPVAVALYRNHGAAEKLLPAMAGNVLVILLTPALLAVGLLLGR